MLAIAALLLGGLDGIRADEPSTATLTTRRLLDALAERQLNDVSLWVLDRVEADATADRDLKAEVPYRRAAALVAASRSEATAAKRSALLDRAAGEIDRFLQTGPSGDLAITAYQQLGNLLVERGRAKLEQAKRPGENAAPLAAEALGFFDQAIRVLEGPKREAGAEITTVTSAEEAVLKELRQVDGQLAEAAGPKDEAEAKPRRPARRPAADTKAQEKLEERQDMLRGQLLSTRLLAAAAWFEKAKALPPGTNEWRETMDAAGNRYRELADKYPSRGAGLFARYYEGRTYAAKGLAEANADERKKLVDRALATLATINGLEGDAGIIPGLRAKGIATALECWLDTKNYGAFDDRLLRLALAAVPADRLDADWLAMKYRAALLLEQRAATEDDKGKRTAALRDARKLALEVARINRDYARDARSLLERLGSSLPDDGDAAESFAGAFEAAGASLAEFQAKQAALKQARAAGQPGDEETAAVTTARDTALASVRRVIERAGPDDREQLNQARYWMTFLLYDARRLHDAAALGDFLVTHYPNARGSRQAATIAMASWQQLARSGPPPWRSAARDRCADVAERIMRTWPAEAEGAEAGVIALASAGESHDGARLVELIGRIPDGSPRRGELQLRGGAALWREVQEQRRLPAAERLSEETVAAWRDTAVRSLDAGLAAVPEGARPDAATVAGALARAQVALDDGDLPRALQLLDHPGHGPWTVVSAEPGDPALATGPLAEGALSVALRAFIQSSATDPAALGRAQQAMDRLEKLAGTGAEASAKLTAMYLAMGRDLEGQLAELAAEGAQTPETQAKLKALVGGFEQFLDGVARRDAKVSSRMWVGNTYLSLGAGGGAAGVGRERAAGFLDKAVKSFEGVLATGGDEVARFEPSIRLRLAGAYRELGRFDEALTHLDWVLSDPKRQNALDVQLQAAELLQAAGEKAADKARAETFLRESIVGRTAGKSVAWGWGGIASKLSRQAFASEDPRALEARARFFDARYRVAAARLLQARRSDSQRAKLLEMAFNDVAITYKLYPGLGGEASRARFDKLLREIQKERGAPSPSGLAELENAG